MSNLQILCNLRIGSLPYITVGCLYRISPHRTYIVCRVAKSHEEGEVVLEPRLHYVSADIAIGIEHMK